MFSDNLLNGLYIIPILAVLILIHEFGHFFAARMSGVKVEEFGIGIPPRIIGFPWRGVLWSINFIPFGGFVRVKGEDGTNMEPDSMNAKSPGKRAFFLAAGAGMNVLLAIVLMILVIGIQGIPHSNVYISAVSPGSPAAKAGWQPGDRIVAVDGHQTETSDEIVSRTRAHLGEPVRVTVERRGKLVDTTVVPRKNPPKGEGRVGVGLNQVTRGDLVVERVIAGSPVEAAGLQPGDRLVEVNQRPAVDEAVLAFELDRYVNAELPITFERAGELVETTLAVPSAKNDQDLTLTAGFDALRLSPLYENVPALKVIPRGFQEAYNATTQMLRGLRELVTGQQPLDQVAGPVGMGQLTSEIIEDSVFPLWVTLANIAIVLSLNLAVLNLLPIPALDGARLLFVLIEVLRGGRRIAPEKEGLVHLAGMVVLIGVMFVIGFADVRRLLDGDAFLR